MSKVSADQFYQQIVKDPELQQKFQTVVGRENTAALAVELGKEKGYNFTVEEAMESINEWYKPKSQEQELSDEQLEAVAGGLRSAFTDNWGCV